MDRALPAAGRGPVPAVGRTARPHERGRHRNSDGHRPGTRSSRMSSTTKHETLIEADSALPTVRIVREFDAPVDWVYRAHVDPEQVKQWLGPRSIHMDITTWDMRTGGEYRYTALRGGEEVGHFYGSVHRVWEDQRIVQTFGFEEMPEAVSLETAEFINLGDGRTRLELLSIVYSMEARDGMLASGMETGVKEGYDALDELLAKGAGACPSRSSRPRSTGASPVRSPNGSAECPRRRGRTKRRCRTGRHATSYGISSTGSRRSSPTAPTSSCRSVRRSTTTRSPRGSTTHERYRRSSTTRRRPAARSPTRGCPRCRWTRRSRGSTPTMSSCTPGTWPERPGRTSGSTRTGAASSTKACSRWTTCYGRAGSTARRCPSPTRPTGRPCCSASSAERLSPESTDERGA